MHHLVALGNAQVWQAGYRICNVRVIRIKNVKTETARDRDSQRQRQTETETKTDPNRDSQWQTQTETERYKDRTTYKDINRLKDVKSNRAKGRDARQSARCTRGRCSSSKWCQSNSHLNRTPCWFLRVARDPIAVQVHRRRLCITWPAGSHSSNARLSTDLVCVHPLLIRLFIAECTHSDSFI